MGSPDSCLAHSWQRCEYNDIYKMSSIERVRSMHCFPHDPIFQGAAFTSLQGGLLLCSWCKVIMVLIFPGRNRLVRAFLVSWLWQSFYLLRLSGLFLLPLFLSLSSPCITSAYMDRVYQKNVGCPGSWQFFNARVVCFFLSFFCFFLSFYFISFLCFDWYLRRSISTRVNLKW